MVGELACLSDLESYTVGVSPQQVQPWQADQKVEARLNGSHWSSRLGVGRAANPHTPLKYLITETEKRIDELIQGCRRVTCELPEDSFLSWNSGSTCMKNCGERKKPAGMAFVGACGCVGGRPGWMARSSGRP